METAVDFCDTFGYELDRPYEDYIRIAVGCIILPNQDAISSLIKIAVETVQAELELCADLSYAPRKLEGGRDRVVQLQFKNSKFPAVLLLEVLHVQEGKARVDDLRNSAVIRDAVYNAQIRNRFRRDPAGTGQVPLPMTLKGCDVCTAIRSQYRAVFSISERRGLTVRRVLEEHAVHFRIGNGALTESFRYFLRDLFGHLNRWHSKGLHLNFIDFDDLFYEHGAQGCGGRITVGNIGRGCVFDVERPDCDQGSRSNTTVKIQSRLVTEAYAEAGRQEVPITVDKSHLKRVRNAVVERGVPECEQSPVSEVRGISSDQLNEVWTSLVGKPVGLLEMDAKHGIGEGNWRQKDLRAVLQGILPCFSAACFSPAEAKMARERLEAALGMGEAATIAFFMNPEQPLATSRLGKLAHEFLSPGSSNPDPKSVVTAPALNMPIFPPKAEHQLLNQGLRLQVGRCVLQDVEWRKKMCKALKDYEEEADQLQVDLVIEEGKGVGVRVVGEWTKHPDKKKKRFGGWYAGKVVRGDVQFSGCAFIVSRADDNEVRCDAEACEMCPLEWFINHGITGPFINSDTGNPNLGLDRKEWFEHDGLIWIPMYVMKDFTGFASWNYKLHLASLHA